MATQAPAHVEAVDVEFTRTVCARIPTIEGEFQLCHYANTRDDKEHLAVIYGDVQGRSGVPVRVHSECFTGDVLGSRRCDCGDQLHYAMAHIAREGYGVVIYLRQEGRGIGLEHKLQAYNLQDEGYDTVQANIMLGHQADEREYWAAAAILNDLGIHSVQLLTNNPTKIEHLRDLGINVEKRLPVIVEVNDDNRAYLETKAQRMRHMLTLAAADQIADAVADAVADVVAKPDNSQAESVALSAEADRQLGALRQRLAAHTSARPFVTLTYAQSINGAIAHAGGAPAQISGSESMRMTHALRAAHSAILVGVGTVLADDPQLTVRHAAGNQPQPVVLDSHLRTPPTARLLANAVAPLIATLAENESTPQAAELEDAGATLLYLPADAEGKVSLPALMAALTERGLMSLMVEGGARVIRSFFGHHLVDALVVTVAPSLLDGAAAIGEGSDGTPIALPALEDAAWTPLGNDLVLWATPEWER